MVIKRITSKFYGRFDCYETKQGSYNSEERRYSFTQDDTKKLMFFCFFVAIDSPQYSTLSL